MEERAALEKATSDYLRIEENIVNTRENEFGAHGGQQTQQGSRGSARRSTGPSAPAARTDLLAQDVGLCASLAVVAARRRWRGRCQRGQCRHPVLAQQQMRLVQTSVELDAAAPAIPEQVQQLQGRLGQIQTDLKGMG